MVRPSLAVLTAAVGAFLLCVGLAVVVVDAHMRSDAATAAVRMSPEELQLLEDEEIVISVPEIRTMLIMQSMTSGSPVPRQAFEITEFEDGGASVSWGGSDEQRVASWGGWQAKPVAVLPAAGLALGIASLFLAAAGWRPPHPQSSN